MKVSVIQMNSVQSVEQNLADAYFYVKKAARLGARLIVLPEMFACFGMKNYAEIAKQYFLTEVIEKSIGAWAKEFSVFIVAGSVPYLGKHDFDRVYASSFLLSDRGHIIARYDKIHLFDVHVGDEIGLYRESAAFLPGENPKVAQVDQALLGMSICYDLRFPELFQYYQAKSCQIISIPSAFTYKTGQQHWEILLRARAIETQSYILAANQVGIHEDGKQTWGHSMIVSPSGEILAQAKEPKPGLVMADLDFKMLENIKLAMPLQKHKRL